MKKLFILIGILICSLNIIAQDIISRKNPKSNINCKITEVRSSFIIYTIIVDDLEKEFSIEKSNIEYIKFSNSEIIDFGNNEVVANSKKENPKEDEDEEIDHNIKIDIESLIKGNTNNAIKFEFLSPMLGFTEIYYERHLKHGISWQVGLGIIGLGNTSKDATFRGLMLKGGYRFYRVPEFYARQNEYTHILKGAYVMPEIKLTYYGYKTDYENISYQNTIGSMSLMINGGKQWVFSNRFLIDLSAGVGTGYYFSKHNDNPDNIWFYNFLYRGTSPIMCSASLKIGYLYKDRKKTK